MEVRGRRRRPTCAGGIYLSNGPNTSSGGSDHGEKEAASLFFFENMQDKEGPLKWQDKTGNNSQVSYPDSWKPGEEYYKDNVAAGTYVEVKGYYVSDNPERIGHGEITYRFMLGKGCRPQLRGRAQSSL